jgi:hypothetical protein
VTTPLVRWNKALPILLNFCQIAEVAQLPPLWVVTASQGLKLDRRTIQTHLNRKDDRYGASGQMVLQIKVSVLLAADLWILRFVADRADYIGMGLSIFMVSYPTVESVACHCNSVEMFDRQMDSAQALTLDEAKELHTKQMAVTIGFEHPVTTTYVGFIRHFEDRELEHTEYLGRDTQKCVTVSWHCKTIAPRPSPISWASSQRSNETAGHLQQSPGSQTGQSPRPLATGLEHQQEH